MKKILICLVTLGLIASCEVEEKLNDVSGQNNDQENFEIYQNVKTAIDMFDGISEEASLDIQESSKSSKESCALLELLIPYQENPIVSFSDYDHYSTLFIDTSDNQCEFDHWSGKIQYYVAGTLTSKWKDSTVFENVRGNEGYVFEGYRISKRNEALSDDLTNVFDVVIDGIVTNLEGDSYHYTANRNFTFENRFTSEEIITLKKSSTLEGINQPFFMRTSSIEEKPIVFKVVCFNRFSFLGYPVQGSQNFSGSFDLNFTIDYGDGTCDKEVTLTSSEGESITFDLQ